MKIDPFYDINQNEKGFDIDEYVLDNNKLDTLMESMTVQDEDEGRIELRSKTAVDSKALDSRNSDYNNQIDQGQHSPIEEDSKNNDVDLQQAT